MLSGPIQTLKLLLFLAKEAKSFSQKRLFFRFPCLSIIQKGKSSQAFPITESVKQDIRISYDSLKISYSLQKTNLISYVHDQIESWNKNTRLADSEVLSISVEWILKIRSMMIKKDITRIHN